MTAGILTRPLAVARQSEQELTILLLFDFMSSANFILDQTFWLPPWSKQS